MKRNKLRELLDSGQPTLATHRILFDWLKSNGEQLRRIVSEG